MKSFMICTAQQIPLGRTTEADEIVRARGAYGKEGSSAFWSETRK
jgi:hypothetical protein